MEVINEHEEIEFFKTLLRFRTVSLEGPSSGAYNECANWLAHICKKYLPPSTRIDIVSPVENKPIVIVCIPGREPDIEGIILNAHYDVVPAMEEFWSVDPWQAIEKDNKIYGRGTQDMKSVAIQYILAIARIYRNSLDKSKPLFRRNVYLSFVPDEEIGGKDGMGALIVSGEFDRLMPNIGCALDEGLATPVKGKNTVFYGERCPLWILVECNGPTGHGSRFIDGTATQKLINVANQALSKRKEQEKILGYTQPGVETGCKHCEAKKLGDVLTINLTVLQAGVSSDGGKSFSMNVIPTKAVAGFDIRVPLTMSFEEVKKMLDTWCSEQGVSWKVDPKTGKWEDFWHASTSINEEENKWWKAFNASCKKGGLQCVPEIFPAGTDSRFIRQKGLSAFGFSPMSGSPILLHEHDEYIETNTFLKGIEIYEKHIIPALGNL